MKYLSTMRTIPCICILFFLLSLIGSGPLAQSSVHPPLYTLSLAKATPLTEVLETVGRRYQLDFAYSVAVAEDLKLPPLTIQTGDLQQFLTQLLAGAAIDFQQVGPSRILLRPREAPAEVTHRTYQGRVLDALTGQPLEWTALALDTLNLGVETDAQGHFTLSVPLAYGCRSLLVQRLGYAARRVTLTDCTNLTIRLEAAPLESPAVTVTARLPTLRPSVVSSATALRHGSSITPHLSGLAGRDLLRGLQLLPGVAAHDDRGTELRIRGSEGHATLLLLDGIPIYRADHYYGIFSAINSDFVEQAELYKNALPAAYSGHTGGMLRLNAAQEVTDPSLVGDVNLLTASAKAAVPLGAKIDLIAAGRSSLGNAANSKFFDWVGTDYQPGLRNDEDLNRQPVVTTAPAFRFADGNLKLRFQPSAGHSFSLNGFLSYDDFDNRYDHSFLTRLRRLATLNEESYQHREQWRNAGASLQHQLDLPDRWQASTTLFYTRYHGEGDISSSLRRSAPGRLQLFGFTNTQGNEVADLGGRLSLTQTPAPDRQLTLGLEAQQHNNHYYFTEDGDTILAGAGRYLEASVFGAYRFRLNDQWEFDLGGRGSYYQGTGRFYLSPRWQLSYRPGESLRFKASYSIHQQFVRTIVHENRLGRSLEFLLLSDDQPYPIIRADQYMLGAVWNRGGFTLDAELFYKDLAGVVEHARLTLGFGEDAEVIPSRRGDYRVFVGDGRTVGLDLLLRYDRQRYSGWMAYTLSSATQRFKEIFRGEPFPTQADRRHQFKWVNTYTLGDFQLGANLVYSSGRPYTDPNLLGQFRDRREVDPSERLRRLPAYFRLDLGATYRFPLGAATGAVTLSLFNLTNHHNVDYLQYIYSLQTDRLGLTRPLNTVIGTETTLLDRTLNLSIRMEL